MTEVEQELFGLFLVIIFTAWGVWFLKQGDGYDSNDRYEL